MNRQNLIGTSLPFSASELEQPSFGHTSDGHSSLPVDVESLTTALSRLYLSEATECCREKGLYEKDRVDVTLPLAGTEGREPRECSTH